jgi:hypothetical protein
MREPHTFADCKDGEDVVIERGGTEIVVRIMTRFSTGEFTVCPVEHAPGGRCEHYFHVKPTDRVLRRVPRGVVAQERGGEETDPLLRGINP